MSKVFKLLLLVILVASFALIFIAIFFQNLLVNSDIQTIIGCLAVIAAVFSTWSALRVIDLAEENNRPIVKMNLNFNRHVLLQIELKNTGKSAAKDITFKWINEPKDEGKTEIFSEKETIRYLSPDENVIRNLGRAFAFPGKYDLIFTGEMQYYDLKGKKYCEKIIMDLTKYMKSMTITNEKDQFFYKMQKLPDQIEAIKNSIINRNN